MARKWYVYVLKDPRNSAVRYVGWSYDPDRRLKNHINQAKKERSYKSSWIKQLLALGLVPELGVVESGTGDWRRAEQDWIAHYRESGAQLTNLTTGGDGMPGYKWTDEQRERLRQREFTPIHRERIAEAKRGKPLTAEHKEAISRKKRNVPISDKRRAELIEIHTGKPLTEEHKRKISEANKGKIPSASAREKMSRSQKGKPGRPQSEETKRKLSEARRGKPGTPWTAEHRRNVEKARARKKGGQNDNT